MKRITTVFLAMLFLLVFCGTALAADNSVSELTSTPPPTRYTYISSASADLDITGSWRADMSAVLSCFPSVDSCRISAYLQRYESGSWVNVQHYSKNSSSTYCSWSASRYVTSGYSYRLRVYFYAYSGASGESTVLNAY